MGGLCTKAFLDLSMKLKLVEPAETTAAMRTKTLAATLDSTLPVEPTYRKNAPERGRGMLYTG